MEPVTPQGDAPPPERLVYTTHEVATMLGVSVTTVERLIRRGEIAVLRIGRAVRFTPDALDDYLARNERPARLG